MAFAGGFIVSFYPKYAPRRGWRVERAYKKSGGTIMSLGFASMAGAAIFILLRADLWVALLLLAAGVAGGMLLMHLLKSVVLQIALAMMAFGWLWFVVVAGQL